VVNGQPYLALRIEYAAEIAPGHGKAWLSLNRLQIARLQSATTNRRRAPFSEDQSDSSVKNRIKNARNTCQQETEC